MKRTSTLLFFCAVLSGLAQPAFAQDAGAARGGAEATPSDRSAAGAAATDAPSCAGQEYWGRAGVHLRQSGQLGERLLAEQLLRMQKSFDEACGVKLATVMDESSVQLLLAQTLASQDPVDVALATQMGLASGNPAQRRALADRWAELEPDNIAPLMHGLIPIETLLLETERRAEYDSHAHALVRLFFNAFRQVPRHRSVLVGIEDQAVLSPEAEAVTAAWALWAAVGLPTFHTLTTACRDEELRAAAVRQQQCMRLGRSLALRSEGLIEKAIGIAILQGAAESPADTQLADRLRNAMDWQRDKWLDVLRSMSEEAQANHAIRMLQTPGVESELQAMQVTLEQHGIPLQPPQGWQSSQRALPSRQ